MMKISLEQAKEFLEFVEKPDSDCVKCRVSDVHDISHLKSQYDIVRHQGVEVSDLNNGDMPFVFLHIETIEAWVAIVADMILSKGWVDLDFLDMLNEPLLYGSEIHVPFDEFDEDIREFDLSEYGGILAYARNVEELRKLCLQALSPEERE